jgi:dolichol kinase
MNVTAAADGLADLDPRIDPELAPLVARTRGLQPWRRLFHAGNGLILAFLPGRIGLTGGALVAVLAGLFGALLALDVARLRSSRLNALFFAAFPALASPREAVGAASSTWYAGGVLLLYALFPVALVVPALLVLALADPAAAVVGRRWGRRRLGKGTWVGTATFAATAFLILGAFFASPIALGIALLTAGAEAVPWRIDDNLTVPLAAASALWLIGA